MALVVQPSHRVAADAAIAFREVRPVGIFPEPEKNTRCALVCAFSQHDFVAWAEFSTTRSITHHDPYLPHSAGLTPLRPKPAAGPVSRMPFRAPHHSGSLHWDPCADIRADYVAGDYQFHTPVLLPAVRRVIGSNRLSLTEALCRD